MLGPLQGRVLQLTLLDYFARRVVVDRGEGLEDMLDDCLVDKARRAGDLVRGVAPAVLTPARVCR